MISMAFIDLHTKKYTKKSRDENHICRSCPKKSPASQNPGLKFLILMGSAYRRDFVMVGICRQVIIIIIVIQRRLGAVHVTGGQTEC